MILDSGHAATNRRFHPENAVWLPKGERYEEENMCLIYRHEDLDDTIESLARWSRQLRNPMTVEPGGPGDGTGE